MVLKYCNVIRHSVVKRMFHSDRRFTTSVKNVCFENLKQRAVLRLSGPDTAKYLQGMVTNDMQVFEPKESDSMMKTCVYTLLLNSHGRVLYDCLLYKIDENDYYLEYDAAAVTYMKKHLNMYKLRKNVTVAPINDLEVWVAYSAKNECSQFRNVIEDAKNNENVVLAVCDPRVKELGVRFIAKKHTDNKSFFVGSENGNVQGSYDAFRYELGIGEGVIDHPPGICLPFETNIDFLHGVSFQKGCYLGQELTARVHFTGVIRKRIMPVIISSSNELLPKLPIESTIVNESGKKMGKLRNHIRKFGLATLKVDECLNSKSLKLEDFDINVTAVKPHWWPLDPNKLMH